MNQKNKRFRTAVAVGASILLLLTGPDPAVAQTWIELTPEGGPSSPIFLRPPASVSYDAAGNRLIVFFTSNPRVASQPLPEVWVLTHANGLGGRPVWIRLAPGGSLPTNINKNHSAVYDAASNCLIVYGGCFASCSPAQSTVYVLTHANGLGGIPTWRRLPHSGASPASNYAHGAAFDAAHQRMIVFGGQGPHQMAHKRVWVLVLDEEDLD